MYTTKTREMLDIKKPNSITMLAALSAVAPNTLLAMFQFSKIVDSTFLHTALYLSRIAFVEKCVQYEVG